MTNSKYSNEIDDFQATLQPGKWIELDLRQQVDAPTGLVTYTIKIDGTEVFNQPVKRPSKMMLQNFNELYISKNKKETGYLRWHFDQTTFAKKSRLEEKKRYFRVGKCFDTKLCLQLQPWLLISNSVNSHTMPTAKSPTKIEQIIKNTQLELQ